MRFQDFVDALYDAGWVNTHDAQHAHIKAFWSELFPIVATMEAEITELEGSLRNFIDSQPPI